MKVVQIDKGSPLHGQIPVGAELVAVNGHPVADEIDFRFHNTEDRLRLEFRVGDKTVTVKLAGALCGDLGLQFAQSKILVCNNKCIFCFVHQQPKGMRRSLYVKDDDFRYSFMHGNYISLSRLTDDNYKRIVRQRLSPIYISVHATDDDLRRRIFGNPDLPAIMPALKRLTRQGIVIHAQTVVCPGINDGDQLNKTIADLASLAPKVASLAVVPVGLTRYRDRLPKLRKLTAVESAKVIGQVDAFQKVFLKTIGIRFVFPADELILATGRTIPSLTYYEDMPQFENGVGMARKFIADFNRRKRHLPKSLKHRLRLGIVTGRSAEPILREQIIPFLQGIRNLQTRLIPVDNLFWGETVTVTGLLTGADIAARLTETDADVILLPPNCLNGDDLFLDDMTLDQFTRTINRPVLTGTYQIADLIRRAAVMGVQ
jgi:putative radical SAM enzyme (TIGR03279 family)